MAAEFTFFVDGIDLSEQQHELIARAVAEAGSTALHKSIARDLGFFEVSGINLRKWGLIGKYLLFGEKAHDLGGQNQELIAKQG